MQIMSEYNNQSNLVLDSIAIRFDAIRLAHVTLNRIASFLIYIVEIFSNFYIKTKCSIIYILTSYKFETRRITYLFLN